MKKNILVLLLFMLFISCIGFAQQEKVSTITFKSEQINYRKYDFSQYGLVNVYVIMYVDNQKNENFENNIKNFLDAQRNLYHSLYYIVKVSELYSLEDKQVIFDKIVSKIEIDEDLKGKDLYFNLDVDYSLSYKINQDKNRKNNIVRIFEKIESKPLSTILFPKIKEY